MSPHGSVHRKWPRTYFYQLLGMKESLDTMQKELSEVTSVTGIICPSSPQDKAIHNSFPFNSSNPINEWESIHQQESFVEVDSGHAPLQLSANAIHLSPSTDSKSPYSFGLGQTTQTDLPAEKHESNGMIDVLYQDLLQKNTKLRQMEQENEQLLDQLNQIKKEPPIYIEKECAACSQHASKGDLSLESQSSLLTNLVEQARFEMQLEKKEKIYWKKECEKVRELVDTLEEELSFEKSNGVLIQKQCIQQTQEIEKLKYYIETECEPLLKRDEGEKEVLRLQLEKAQSQIRVLQSTVQKLSASSSSGMESSEHLKFSPKKSEMSPTPRSYTPTFMNPTPPVDHKLSEQLHWESHLEMAKRLEKDLKDLHHRRDMLQSEYVKIPLTGVQHRRRKEELDAQLDAVDKDIGYIRMKLKTMNFL